MFVVISSLVFKKLLRLSFKLLRKRRVMLNDVEFPWRRQSSLPIRPTHVEIIMIAFARAEVHFGGCEAILSSV